MQLLNKFWTPERLNRIGLALGLALVIALIFSVLSDQRGSSLVKRGDFPGFYVLAEIHKLDRLDKIYEPELQRQIQNQYWPDLQGGFYMSVYPPYVATLLAPLANFNPQVAQIIFTSLMFLCFISSCLLASRLNFTFDSQKLAHMSLALFFAPLFVGILGAQNTALSMLLLILICSLIRNETRLSDFFAGIFCGLWFFKPQFALFMLILMLVTRLWFALLGASISGVLYYAIAAKQLGFLWPLEWIKALQRFSDQNFISNAPQMTSISGTLKAVLGYYDLAEGNLASILNILTTAFVVAIFSYMLIKAWQQTRKNLFTTYLSFAPLIILVSPQTLFYDLGIALIAYLTMLDLRFDRSYWELAAILIFSWCAVLFREQLPMPLFFLFALYFFWKILAAKNNPAINPLRHAKSQNNQFGLP